MTGKKLSSIYVANMDITYWSVLPSNRSGGDGVKGMEGMYRYLARYEFHFIRVHNNLVNNKSITITSGTT